MIIALTYLHDRHIHVGVRMSRIIMQCSVQILRRFGQSVLKQIGIAHIVEQIDIIRTQRQCLCVILFGDGPVLIHVCSNRQSLQCAGIVGSRLQSIPK